MHRPGPRDSGARFRRRVVGVEAAALLAAELPGGVARGTEAQHLFEQRAARLRAGREGADAVEALEGDVGRDLGVARHERLVGRLRDHELEAEAFGVVEAETGSLAGGPSPVLPEPRLPEVERLLRGDPERDSVHHPGARPSAARTGVLEERDVRARAALLVGVEQVIDGRVVLVDRFLHEPEPEHAGVERDVARRVARDARHVVNPLELHRASRNRARRAQITSMRSTDYNSCRCKKQP